jgi:hypothetical protein
MRSFFLLPLGLFCGLASAFAAEPVVSAAAPPTNWDHVKVEPMKTSIYIGTVNLTTGVFERQGSSLTTTYEAKVFPWFFWGETGKITIALTDTGLAALARGETAEFAGDAVNQKNKLRKITGRAQPADANSGKMKVRIMADGIELIFNSTYQFLSSTSAAAH